MADLRIIETGDGGDFVFTGKDLEMIDGFQNMPYLALFGGNVESITKEFRPTEQRFDWWGNTLLMPQNSAIQWNSQTEKLLNESALSSAGRLQIEQAIKTDLAFFKTFSAITIFVSITSVDRIQIDIQIVEPETQESTEFVYIWDSTQQELTQQNSN